MPRQKTTISQLRVGILVVATITILIIFILGVSGGIPIFQHNAIYHTRFSAAEGLKKGDEVRLVGKLIGKVDSVEFSRDIPASKDEKPIVITMVVDAKEADGRIRRDSLAVLAQQGFLGDRVIDITAGTRSAEQIADGGEIPSADQAGLAQVFQGASDILVQFNTVGKQLQELMDNVNQGKGTIGKLLHDDAFYVNLNRAVLEYQDIAARVSKGDGTIGRLLNDPKLYDDLRGAANNVQAIVADVRGGKGTLGKLINDEQFYKQANEVLAKFNSTTEKLDKIAGDIQAGRGTLGKFLKDEKLHDDAQAAVASLRNISDRLDKGEGSAGKLLRDEKLYDNLNQTSAELAKFMYDFRQNPKKFLRIKLSLF
ncbi:MAG TPA: MlaD family protein [Blastocatellia bacterium]|nr:MlaD family protein [Blastocatellia bacterium]